MRQDIAAPDLAWPTLVLTIATLLGWLATLVAAWTGVLPAPLAVAVLVVFAYVSFTPMHDASHRSVARAGWLNEVIGRLSALPLGAPFAAFRYVHLEHHRHTNEPERDPDLWSGGVLHAALPLRWITQDFHYYVVYGRVAKQRPRAEAIEVFASLFGGIALAVALVVLGFGWELLLFVLIPGRLAIGMLAFSFDYLPHSPHAQRGRKARFTNTSNLRLTRDSAPGWLSVVLLFQNYHLVHHLYPGVPFYRYAKVWRGQEEQLRAKGASERPLIDALLGRSPA